MASSAPNNDNDAASDAAISQFLAFTGASDPSVARQYLEMSGNNVETAVGLFMDHGGGGLGGAGGGGLGGGGGAGGLGGGGAFGGAPQEVRAPDATRTMRLVGGPPSPLGGAGGPPFPGGGMGGGMGGFGGMDDDDQPPAALVAAMGGPAAREMLRGMAMAGMDNNSDAVMGGTWAAAGAASMGGGGGDTARMGSGSSSRRSRSGSGASGGNARRNSGGRRGSDADNNNNQNDGAGGGGAQAMDEDDHDNEDNDSHEYNYDDDSDDDSHDLGDGSPGHGPAAARRVPTHPPSLTTMFAPPTHLMHRAGGFLGARNFAKDARRWLLVNVQTEDDFACHALNRDVWRDELVENLVREGFVLWQTTNATNEGQTYIARYKVQGYPHLAILDPRTGSLLWRKEGWTQVHPLTAEQFVEIASDFCSRHSFDKLPMAARSAYLGGVPPGAAAAASSSSHDGGGGGRAAAGGGNKRPLAELTEEEQLQAAIRASMAENAGGGSGDDDDEEDGTNDGGAVVTDGGEDIGKKPSSDNNDATAGDDDEPKPSAFEREILSMEVADEPPGGPGTARVQIRMPDGKRLVRRFVADDPVKAIYAFVAHSNEEARGGRAFELKAKFPPQDLLPMAGDGIAATGLNGEAINVMWK